MPVAKTKALISFAVTAKLICAFVFAYAKCLLSHDVAHMLWLPIKKHLHLSEVIGKIEKYTKTHRIPSYI